MIPTALAEGPPYREALARLARDKYYWRVSPRLKASWSLPSTDNLRLHCRDDSLDRVEQLSNATTKRSPAANRSEGLRDEDS